MSDLISSTQRKVVVGLGATGLSVARYLARRGEDFCVFDTRDAPPCREQLLAEIPGVGLLTGAVPQEVLNTAGELIVSPGINPAEPWLQEAVAAGASLRGDIDLFMAEARAPVVGITGSNAKSTVTDLVGAMAVEAGLRVGVGGNLGTPALDLLDEGAELYVLELSSFQLERAGELGLAVATVLNVTPDHLDRHGSMPRYHQAKHRIFAGCSSVIYHADDPLTIPPIAGGRRQISWRLREPELDGFGLREEGGETYLARGFDCLMPVSELPLPGRHNLANALAALAIGHAAGLPIDAMLRALHAYGGLPHRCELVAERDGVEWVNDSKATNVAATVAAVEGLGRSRRLLLIAGGRDKAGDYRALRGPVQEFCDVVLLIGESAPLLAEALAGAAPIEAPGVLAAAVRRAAELARPGHTVLLSPACASFDQFASYAARGDAFRSEVREVLAA
ncbi:MAG: UDP-N-acetylmuramoyl-L-alanine--D-glutamate ligase [Halieaceae bacterium]|nr:UDP-N-acetylmuramoyl-L-alanine--D-glutamate ligase [Halieaceae bacterium]